MKLEATVSEQTTVDSRAEPCQQFEVDRKRAEEELRRSEEKYRDLIEISPDAIYVIDAEGICLLGNRAGAELAGIPEDELVGSPVTQTYLPEERHMLRQRIEKLRVEGTLRFERSFLRQNGISFP